MRTSQTTALFSGLLSAVLFTPLLAQGPDTLSSGSEWTQYRGNLAGTGFSPLTQINQDNGGHSRQRLVLLTDLPTHSIREENPRAPNSQVTPIVVEGVMYLPAADRVIALDPVSGAELWTHQRFTQGAASRRGVSYWPGDDGSPSTHPLYRRYADWWRSMRLRANSPQSLVIQARSICKSPITPLL